LPATTDIVKDMDMVMDTGILMVTGILPVTEKGIMMMKPELFLSLRKSYIF